jgi:hypothetical protein
LKGKKTQKVTETLTASNKQTLFFFILFSTGDFKEQANRKLGRRKTFT